ncbi:polysaccharide deacetylase family protein [Bacillus sp. Marseille-P3661]|uniref:polysaccharide deacetylase family protein n=1 Tax=Bacillus sp. Marseille-P3661 TaxID=1936234 RepID=UPI000C818CBD|nr:polysaccharide deacetylase family protein [Bacillus sp. Marseille-P3661]
MTVKMNFFFIVFIGLFLITGCTNSTEMTQEIPTESVTANENNDFTELESGADVQQTESNENTVEQPVVNQPPKETTLLPLYKMNEVFDIKPISDAPENIVLLTIDDAPDKYALEMAKILKDLNVGAIFFVNGHFLNTDEKKAILKEIYEMGFPIGNHTMNHENLKKLSEEEQKYQIIELNNLVESITGERPKFFRAPFGANTDYSKLIANEEKMLVMNWTYGYDFEKDYMNKETLEDIMVNTNLLHKGANLLMHDREWTRDALAGIVKGLQNKGYEIVDPHLIQTPE